MKTQTTTTTPTPGARLQTHNLTRAINNQTLLHNINLHIPPGQILTIMGPSGSGKTLLLKHLIGLEKPDTGTIHIDHQPLTPQTAQQNRLAIVFQTSALLNNLTIQQNISLYHTEHRQKTPQQIQQLTQQKLQLVNLQHAAHLYPPQLSGGMKKRAAIARALTIQPRLILYDEPTSELDPPNAHTITQEILRQNQQNQTTTIIVTHDPQLAFQTAHKIAIIHQGKIRHMNTPTNIRQHPDPYIQHFLNPQTNPNPTQTNQPQTTNQTTTNQQQQPNNQP